MNKPKPKLSILDIGNNSLELEGAEAFAEYFQSYDYLGCISLNSTGLSSEGVKILVDSLTKSAESGSLK